MQYEATERLELPAIRSNPFEIRPLSKSEVELFVGRKELFSALTNHIRFGSSRVVALVGEKGSGRTSLIQCVASTTEQTHEVFWSTEKNKVITILHQMYIHLMNDFETPPIHSVLIDRLEKELSGNSGKLPMIVFDLPHVSGNELSEVLTFLMPVLTKIRALTIITLTPGQMSSFSEEMLSEMDVTNPLEPLTKEEMTNLINKRFHKASRSSWTAPPSLVNRVMDESGGHVARSVRYLRNFVDDLRGMPLSDSRSVGLNSNQSLSMNVNITTSNPTEVEDTTFQRVANITPSVSKVEVEILDNDVVEEGPMTQSTEIDLDESDDDSTLFPSLSEAADMWADYDSEPELEQEEEPEQIPEPSEEPSLDIGKMEIQEAPKSNEKESWKQEFKDSLGGAEVLEMQPGTAPALGGGRLGGLRSRVSATNKAISASKGMPQPTTGPVEAKPNEEKADPNRLRLEASNDKVAFWVQEGTDSPIPQKPEIEHNPLASSNYIPETEVSGSLHDESEDVSPSDALAALSSMRRVSPPINPTITLDVNALMNLNETELFILEQALEREVSPSDEFIQQTLAVGRPRLSQIFNGLLKYGVLTVRKQGRSRLFRISSPAKDHLVNIATRGED
ncbi:MAG: hypothetical protein CMO20_00470 [Thermoplasmata archaeon]|nr:hypothetical protein [Thermoplasmata archaeon]